MATSSADGFSLIEVLIALFVLVVGVIGAAGMQLAALRTSQQSSLQTTALHLALDIAEMMRGNALHSQPNDAANPYLAIDSQVVDSATADIPSTMHCDGKDVVCSTPEFVSFEISRWLQRVHRELPNARVIICRDAQAWDAAAGQYTWVCTNTPNAAILVKIGWPDKTLEERAAHNEHDAYKNFAPSIVLPIGLPGI